MEKTKVVDNAVAMGGSMAADITDSIESLSYRSFMYELIAGLFMRPLTQEQIEALAGLNLEDAAWASEGEMRDGLTLMGRYLRRCDSGTREDLAVDYTSVFYGVHTFEGKAALPFESMHATSSQRYMGSAWSSVFNVYKRMAIKLEVEQNTPEDHLSYECLFMAHMVKRTREAIERGDAVESIRALKIQSAFLERHILSWFGVFRAVAETMLEQRFYRGALQAAGAFFHADLQEIDTLVAEIGARSQVDAALVKIDLAELERGELNVTV